MSVAEAALRVLAGLVRALPGSEGVEILRGGADDARFLFIERWTDAQAHAASAALVPGKHLP